VTKRKGERERANGFLSEKKHCCSSAYLYADFWDKIGILKKVLNGVVGAKSFKWYRVVNGGDPP
jgi:hypothetical protein